MKTHIATKLGVLVSALLGITACSSKSTDPADQPAKIAGKTLKMEDSTTLANTNVILYDANANAPVARVLSDATGNFAFEAPAGDYYLTVAAQGRIPSPPKGGQPLPFHADSGKTFTRNVFLERDTATTNTGGLSGSVTVTGNVPAAGILIVAQAADSTAYSSTTGPDGYFAIYNLPPGNYTLRGYRDSLVQDTTTVKVAIRTDSLSANTVLRMSVNAGKILRGKIRFLASSNSTVDITLVNPWTREAIPGLSVKNDSSNSFILRGIPPGDYTVWASYRNDGYVMDPDAIRKFGFPKVSFSATDTAKNVDFDVTGAVTVVSPTNAADTVYPRIIHTRTPAFKWVKYPSTKEYIVEVFDANGKRIWGGFSATGAILHPSIPASADSVVYNFDNSATSPLKAGGIYTWKVYADNDAQANVQGLISSSENLRGLFQVVLP
jgi:hypothetical protein